VNFITICFIFAAQARIAATIAISTVAPIGVWRNLFVMESLQGGTFE